MVRKAYVSQSQVKGLIKRRTSAEDAKWDAVALMLAMLQDIVAEGERGSMRTTQAQLAELMQEPPRLASATLTIMQMVRRLADSKEGGFPFLCQNLVDSIPEMA